MANIKKPTPKKAAITRKPDSPGVFDISRPGSGAAASATSRPTIIKHQLMTDPMVNSDPKSDDMPSAPPLSPARKVVIKPIHDTIEPEAEPTPAVELPAETESDTVKVTVNTNNDVSAEEPTEAAEPAVESQPEESAGEPVAVQRRQFAPGTTIADVAPEPDTSGIPAERPARDKDAEVSRARAVRLQKMIDEEEYFLPIETMEERRSRRFALIGLLLIILLAAAWYNVALDANLLPNQFDLPHTSFFSVN